MLRRLQARTSALTSALIVGVIWATWHAPLFAFPAGLAGLGPGGTVGWIASILTASILFTWLLNATGGSIPMAAIFHGTMDVAFLASGPAALSSTLGAIVTIWGVAILLRHGPATLAPSSRVT